MSDAHAQSVGFVRRSEIPPAPPPAAASGARLWLRENLFGGPFSIVLTVVSLAAIFYLLSGFIPWLLNGVWRADSIRECREVLEARGDETGACLAVIRERWGQMLFGVYPREYLWRPLLTLVLFLGAAAPVLFQSAPRRLFWLTGLFPFLAYWLIWGGTLWGPLLIIASFAAAVGTFRLLSGRSFPLAVAGALVALVGVWLVTPALSGALADVVELELRPVATREIGGFMLNFILGVTCVSLSLPLGIVLALGRQSDLPIIKAVCVAFIEFIRGVPLITLLFVANVVLAYFLPPGTNFDLILRVIIMITLFAAAYIAEVIRGGLAALPRGQYEAADALGLGYWQAMRLIILPQALKISIPGITNVAIGLFKDTTLVSIISMFDLLGVVRSSVMTATAWNGIYWEALGFAALLFFVVCYPISQYSQHLERRLATDHR